MKRFLLGQGADEGARLGCLGWPIGRQSAAMEKFGKERQRIRSLLDEHFRTTGAPRRV